METPMKTRNLAADVDLIAAAVIENLQITTWEYGGIGVDPKRPFGNSDVEGDMLELLGCEMAGDDGFEPCWSSEQKEYVRDIYHNRVIPRIQEVFGKRTPT
jgi:hypothetical protein